MNIETCLKTLHPVKGQELVAVKDIYLRYLINASSKIKTNGKCYLAKEYVDFLKLSLQNQQQLPYIIRKTTCSLQPYPNILIHLERVQKQISSYTTELDSTFFTDLTCQFLKKQNNDIVENLDLRFLNIRVFVSNASIVPFAQSVIFCAPDEKQIPIPSFLQAKLKQ